ncbi:transcription elongation factor GreA [Hathewaya limosa]|uniref:Transcription elongation factor GreA n=1 Tax=Hathewaya limosa TaxID=1536 RepID=A0ABU0JR90_HATLI|nr:transcription elongation factor GreA [Hathewaya limosa]AWZ49581.1 transcription elongation factor GreA [Clostridiaceae bacterium 14S0207]MDQ0478569.1 transcription elongation factor GreA [Hathewaya limosa]
MSDSKKYMMTPEGIEKLEDELEFLKTVKRREITEKIKVALSFGDLSENAEYDEAKNEQAFLEARIANIENTLRNAIVIDETDLKDNTVNLGCVVKVKDYTFDEEVDFKIVGSAEAEPMEYKISNESPVGSALMGRKVGDVVEVAIPDGMSKYEILEVKRG